jgi:hypothetical protein
MTKSTKNFTSFIGFFLISCIALFGCFFLKKSRPFVMSHIIGQLGNNLFQVATASALAWDNQAEPRFPDFGRKVPAHPHVFSRCNTDKPSQKIRFKWYEPSHTYQAIPFHPNMRINGYFQSEKYFAHHRERILQLFAPLESDLIYMREKYAWLIDHPNSVGVQIRYYRNETLPENMYPQYGKAYLEKAMRHFPEDSLFVVSSNNLDFAKSSVPAWAKNVVFLQDEPNYIDLYLLSFCKHNIITNSSFGWWAAWLNQNPNKIVVRPSAWINGIPCEDVCPNAWVEINAEYN